MKNYVRIMVLYSDNCGRISIDSGLPMYLKGDEM